MSVAPNVDHLAAPVTDADILICGSRLNVLGSVAVVSVAQITFVDPPQWPEDDQQDKASQKLLD
jgi:hypothetical protein